MGIALPDAVVCANDDMAIGYIKMAEQFGYKVPDDVLVTGFDNLSQAYCNIPSIASVGRSRESLGRQAVEQLIGMMEGRKYPHAVYVKSGFSPSLSCGCGKGIEDFKKHRRKKRTWSITIWESVGASISCRNVFLYVRTRRRFA